jgi:hypothetical protein
MKKQIDTETGLSQIEAGRVRTLLHGRGVRLRYVDLVTFNPAEIAKLPAVQKAKIKAEEIAKLANRPEITQEAQP